jgi:hypothetical protein
VLLAENVSKAASLCLCKEDVSKDIKGVPLQSPYALFVFANFYSLYIIFVIIVTFIHLFQNTSKAYQAFYTTHKSF